MAAVSAVSAAWKKRVDKPVFVRLKCVQTLSLTTGNHSHCVYHTKHTHKTPPQKKKRQGVGAGRGKGEKHMSLNVVWAYVI